MEKEKTTLGRPMLYGEQTVTISIKVPKSRKEFYNKLFRTYVKVTETFKRNESVT